MSRSITSPALCALVLVLLALYTARNLQVSTGIGHLLPEADQELALVSSQLVDSPLTRRMVLTIGGPDLDTARTAARGWAALLAGEPEVASVRIGPDPALAETIYDLYFPRRFLFYSSDPERELPDRVSPRGLRDAAERLLAELASPRGQFISDLAPADPLLSFSELITRFEAAAGSEIEVLDGQFVDAEDATAILFLTTHHSPFDAPRQSALEATLMETFAEVERESGAALRLERSSVHRFAVASEKRARGDMNRLSLLSVLGIGVLFFGVFRSLRMLAIALLPILGGVLAAAAAGIAVFGELHVMTLAFGGTLMGVCVDYPIHYLNSHTLNPEDGPRASLSRVWPAIALGGLTTIAGFAGLAWSNVPGLREIGVFAATGVFASLVIVRFVVPSLVSKRSATPAQLRFSSALGRLLGASLLRKRLLSIVLLLACGVAAAGLSRISLEEDVFRLSISPDPAWLEEDERVRARVMRTDPGSFVISFGPDEEAALQANDAAFNRLQEAQQAGELEGFRSLHDFLFSADLQRRNLQALRSQPDLPERLTDTFVEAGFRAEPFEAFAQDVRGEAPKPLTFDDLLRSPLAELVAPFRIAHSDRVVFLTPLRGVADEPALRARLAGLEGSQVLDQRSFVRDIYSTYRSRAAAVLGLGFAAIVGLVYLRYRRVRAVIVTVLPATLAGALTLSLLSLAGIAISLLHLLGLVLVLSVGVDYAIFLLDGRANAREEGATMLSLVVACATTCLAFGLLGFSSFPALRDLGLATAIGTLLSLVLAPFVALLATGGAPDPRSKVGS